MKKLFIVFLFISFSMAAQEAVVDSLKNVIKNAKHDTMVARTYCYMSEVADKSEDVLLYAQKGLAVSLKGVNEKNEKIFNSFMYSKALAYGNIAYYYLDYDKLDSAISNFDSSLKYLNILKYEKAMAGSYNNLAFCYQKLANYPEALSTFKKCLALYEKLGDLGKQCAAYRHLSMVYEDEGKQKLAFDNLYHALGIAEKMNDPELISHCLSDIGTLHGINMEVEKAMEFAKRALSYRKALKPMDFASRNMNLAYLMGTHLHPDSGIAQMEFSKEIYEKMNDKRGLATMLGYKAYFYIHNKMPKEALPHCIESVKLEEAIGNPQRISGAYMALGRAYAQLKDYDKALVYAIKSNEIAKKLHKPKEMSKNAELLYEIYAGKGDYKNSLIMYKNYIAMRDCVFSAGNRKALIQKEFAHDFDKKEALLKAQSRADQEKRDAVSAEERRRQNVILLSALVVVILVVVIALIIYRSLRQNKKAQRIIKLQKEEVESQRDVIEEKQKELLDSIRYARRIQKAHLPTEKKILGVFERMHKN